MSLSATRTSDLFRMPSTAALGDAIVMGSAQTVSGTGSLRRLGEVAKPHGDSALIVTHRPGRMRASGAVEVAVGALSKCGISANIFEISQTPSVEEIDEGTALFRNGSFDMSIGIGGGSALDACKAISLLSANGASWEELQMGGIAGCVSGPPIIAVPTTAGSGSEATSVAVIRNENLGIIKSVSSPFMIPTVVILDSSLIISGSSSLHALAGFDAFSHAVESFTSRRASDLTKRVSMTALPLIFASLPAIVSGNPTDSDYMNLMLGSHFAGQALSAGVGAAHILAQPISSVLGVNHGTALSLVFEEVIRFNEELPEDPYRLLVDALSGGNAETLRMSEIVTRFMSDIDVLKNRSRFGSVKAIPKILDSVERSTGHIWTNPRNITTDALEGILLRSWQHIAPSGVHLREIS